MLSSLVSPKKSSMTVSGSPPLMVHDETKDRGVELVAGEFESIICLTWPEPTT